MSVIKKIEAREILDSRGNPTIAVALFLDDGRSVQTAVPSGASTGDFEAVELRDGGERYGGKGVLEAIKNIEEIIASQVEGMSPTEQRQIDNLMIELDATSNKSQLGANAILAVSQAVAKAGAVARGLPLYEYLAQLAQTTPRLPRPFFNVINGGVHAGNRLAVQEFMISPRSLSMAQTVQVASELYHSLQKKLIEKYGRSSTLVGDEGGFAPALDLSLIHI